MHDRTRSSRDRWKFAEIGRMLFKTQVDFHQLAFATLLPEAYRG
jgi:hypothetical protein